MAILKCKMCGGDIKTTDNTYGTCDSCGSTMTLPKASDDRKANLFNRANHFRRQNDFDKAVQAYENILNEDSSDAEAHWGIVLSRYGIEYVEDPATGKRIPTCHRVQSESILKDADYIETIQHAPDEYTRSLYEEEAKQISEIQKGILAISNKEQPYDVFICYKETTDGGSRTKDSTIAQDIYYELTKDGYKVFFARITLEDKLGQQYEPYIFSALNSAKVMLVIGTKKENFESVWVKNEWIRFLAIMKKDRSRLLIPCYRDMDAYDIPDELSNLQSQDMSKVGFIQDILRGVKKILDASKSADKSIASSSVPAAPGVESFMKRGKLFLEDSDWKQADGYFDKVLDIDPEYAPAYIGKLCVELKLSKEELLGDNEKPLTEYSNYQKALRFTEANYRIKLEGYNKLIQNRIEEDQRKEQEHIAEQNRQEQERIAEDERRREGRIPYLDEVRKKIVKFQKCISTTWHHTVGLKVDGTVVTDGYNESEQCRTWSWRDIVAVSTGCDHTVGLKADGTVVAVGSNSYGQCNTESWRDIIEISAGSFHTVGLKADGTVLAVGRYEDIHRNTEDWRDIVAIAAGVSSTVGLKADGTVVVVEDNSYSQCSTSSWRDIVAITADYETVGLKLDGTVVGGRNTKSWRDIVAVAAGGFHTVGLKADGTVIAVGDNEEGQCNTESWSDIVAISASSYGTVGLKSDGTVVAVGKHKSKSKYERRMGKSDWYSESRTINVSGWRDIGPISKEKLLEKQHSDRLEQQNKWASEGLCRYCGGKLGIFGRKCKSCGKAN